MTTIDMTFGDIQSPKGAYRVVTSRYPDDKGYEVWHVRNQHNCVFERKYVGLFRSRKAAFAVACS